MPGPDPADDADAPAPPVPEAAAPEVPELPEEVEVELQDAGPSLEDLQRGLGDVLREVRRSNGFIDELHQENQRLRQGEHQTLLAPVVRDVASLHDAVVRLADGASEEVAEVLELVRRQVVELLDRQGVVTVDPPAGSPLDPALHQVAGLQRTDDPHADRTVARVRRTGFAHPGGRVVRPADVEVHRYQPAEEP